ncbi:hypothetical protein L1049_012419 [Liquidambar formosana]|uniref:Uncharacterized protein n=1 Tax=Liquidambar formosana TaxID=63359 RepID=A0AAP0N5L1_LIQFO
MAKKKWFEDLQEVEELLDQYKQQQLTKQQQQQLSFQRVSPINKSQTYSLAASSVRSSGKQIATSSKSEEPLGAFSAPSSQLLLKNKSRFHHKTNDFRKDQAWYQYVLEKGSKSTIFKHNRQENDPSDISHSTCNILRILSPSDWGQPLYQPRKLPGNILPNLYNYFDYEKAWQNTFFVQNKINRHSWMIYFDQKFDIETILLWFLNWWYYFGPIQEILPEQPINISKSYTYYEQQIQPKPHLQIFPKLFLFYANFGLAWIMFWRYDYTGTQQIPCLGRTFHVKWWDNARMEHITPKAI